MNNKKRSKVLTFGTFDLMHSGHFNIFLRLNEIFDEIHVGIVPDEEIIQYKNVKLAQNQEERLNNVGKISIIKNAVILSREIEDRIQYIKDNKIENIAIGSDHANNKLLIEISERLNIELIILDRTEGISSTLIRNQINKK